MKIIAVIAFIAMYVLMTLFMKRRVWIVLAAAAFFIISGIISPGNILPSINWNVILMITGTMILVDYFIASKMPNRIADMLLDRAPNVMWVTIFMSLFAGAISAFIDNVATVLMVAPVGLAICRKLKISPVPMILSIAVSSNLQGAATLVGDTTSIMLGAYAGMDFTDFFWMAGRPGMFFAVELGALATVPVMMFLFRREKDPVHAEEKTAVTDYIPTILLISMVVALIAVSFNKNKPELTNGVICCVCAAMMVLLDISRTGSTEETKHALKSIDFETVFLLIGLFIGACLPFVFAALTMDAVGRAAQSVVIEVRRQFKKITGLMEGKADPDYAKCVDMCSRSSLKEMILPTVIAIVVPIVVGLVLGFYGVVGMLAGATASGFLMAIFMSNSGGAWDNAKKYIEAGNHGGKGSDQHKAAVVGDTVGDPFKDTSGPSINILIKLLSMVSIVFAALVVQVHLFG